MLQPSRIDEKTSEAETTVASLVSWLCHAREHIRLFWRRVLGSNADLVVYLPGHDLRHDCTTQTYRNQKGRSGSFGTGDFSRDGTATSTPKRDRTVIDLSIIIVNWKSTAFILKCVESVYANTHEVKFEILVVDNASPDGDIGLVKQRFPEVILIESPTNLGFARANNLGFRTSRGEFVVFLNPDTILENAAFDRMIPQVRALSNVGAVGCKLLNRDESVQTSAIQTFPTILNQLLDIDVLRNRFPACRLWNIAPLYSDAMEPSRVEVISGACVMFMREVFASIGQFSEEYFMYAEDLDLCYKSAKAGYANYYIPQGQIMHYGGGSSNPRRAVPMKWKSILKYVAKHRGPSYQLAFRAVMACGAFVRIALLMALMAVTGDARKNSVRNTLTKWWLVLTTMLTPIESKPQVKSLATEGVRGR